MKTKNILKTFTQNIASDNLQQTQSLLIKINYELIEIWTPDNGNEKQIWWNSHNNTKIELIIEKIEEDNTNENDYFDNVMSEMLSSLTDVWVELNKVNEVILENDEDRFFKRDKKLTSFEKFKEQVDKFKKIEDDDSKHLKFIMNEKLDVETFSFLTMDEEDQSSLIH